MDGRDSRTAPTTRGSFSPKALVAMRAPMSRKRYGRPAVSRSMTARYGPTDSAGSKATGSEKNRLPEALSSAACEAARCCSTNSSSARSPSRSASGTYAWTSPARYRALSCATDSRDFAAFEIAASNVFTLSQPTVLRLFRHNGDRFDFDHELFAREFSDLYQSACRGILAVILGANVSECLYLRHVGDVRVDLHHVVERRAGGGKGELQVLEDLSRLNREITFAHHIAGFVERNLARDVDRPAAVDFDDVGVAGRHRQSWRIQIPNALAAVRLRHG